MSYNVISFHEITNVHKPRIPISCSLFYIVYLSEFKFFLKYFTNHKTYSINKCDLTHGWKTLFLLRLNKQYTTRNEKIK